VRRILVALSLLVAITFPALAVEPNERLADPVLEARAREISKNLRCLVCQNESIDESNADLAHDVRVLLRERLTAGDTDAQAVKFIVDRYGQFVLLRPPIEPATYVLWFGPALVVLLAAAGTALAVRNRRRDAQGPPPLNEAEQQRLARLMRESDG
jgi:cytochrome c-type biogenesis protein CcmH